MIQIPKRLTLFLIIILGLTIIVYSIVAISNINSILFFKYSKSIFALILLATIFINSYSNEKLKYYLFMALIIAAVNYSFLLIKLMNYGWLEGKQLYWQIAALLIGFISISLSIYVLKKDNK